MKHQCTFTIGSISISGKTSSIPKHLQPKDSKRHKSMAKGAQGGRLAPGEKKKLRKEKMQVGSRRVAGLHACRLGYFVDT